MHIYALTNKPNSFAGNGLLLAKGNSERVGWGVTFVRKKMNAYDIIRLFVLLVKEFNLPDISQPPPSNLFTYISQAIRNIVQGA